MSLLSARLRDPGVVEPLRRLAEMPEWLTSASIPERVSASLTSAVPELASGAMALAGCTPKLRLKDDQAEAWAVSYRVRLVDGHELGRELALSGALFPPTDEVPGPALSEGSFGTESWHGRVPELGVELRTTVHDEALPGAALLTDADSVRPVLEEAIRAGAYPDIRITSCAPQVMRYKVGSRCTVRYHLELGPGSPGPDQVVAKAYRGDKGANAFAGMQALWSAAAAFDGVVTLAEPLAYLPERRVLIQGPVKEETTLKDLARSVFADPGRGGLDVLRGEVAKTAHGLAALHTSGVRHGETLSWKDERAEVRELLDRLAPSLPDVVGAVTPLLGALEQLDAEVAPDGVVATHRSFRPAQVLLHQGQVAFIDFDGFCTAEPALDVALFRAALRDVSSWALLSSGGATGTEIDPGLQALDELCDEFLSHYESHASVSRARVALWETLDLLTYVLHCWTKVKPDRLPARLTLLGRHLGAGLTILS